MSSDVHTDSVYSLVCIDCHLCTVCEWLVLSDVVQEYMYQPDVIHCSMLV